MEINNNSPARGVVEASAEGDYAGGRTLFDALIPDGDMNIPPGHVLRLAKDQGGYQQENLDSMPQIAPPYTRFGYNMLLQTVEKENLRLLGVCRGLIVRILFGLVVELRTSRDVRRTTGFADELEAITESLQILPPSRFRFGEHNLPRPSIHSRQRRADKPFDTWCLVHGKGTTAKRDGVCRRSA